MDYLLLHTYPPPPPGISIGPRENARRLFLLEGLLRRPRRLRAKCFGNQHIRGAILVWLKRNTLNSFNLCLVKKCKKQQDVKKIQKIVELNIQMVTPNAHSPMAQTKNLNKKLLGRRSHGSPWSESDDFGDISKRNSTFFYKRKHLTNLTQKTQGLSDLSTNMSSFFKHQQIKKRTVVVQNDDRLDTAAPWGLPLGLRSACRRHSVFELMYHVPSRLHGRYQWKHGGKKNIGFEWFWYVFHVLFPFSLSFTHSIQGFQVLTLQRDAVVDLFRQMSVNPPQNKKKQQQQQQQQ